MGRVRIELWSCGDVCVGILMRWQQVGESVVGPLSSRPTKFVIRSIGRIFSDVHMPSLRILSGLNLYPVLEGKVVSRLLIWRQICKICCCCQL